MVSRTKLTLATAAVLVPLLLIAVSMSLVFAQDGELDVGVFKSDDPDPIMAGDDLSYTILVTNSFGVTATNVVVTDTLPPEVEYITHTDTCTLSGGTGPAGQDQLICQPGDLDPGEQVSFTIDVHVVPDAFDPTNGDAFANTVVVSATSEGGGGDTATDNNFSAQTTSLWEEADLAIEKTAFPGDVVPIGEWFSYTLSVQNLGPSNSRVPIVMDWFATDGSLSLYAEGGWCGPMPTDQGWAEAPAWLMTWLNAVCQIEPDLPICDGYGFSWLEAWWYYWYETFPPMYPYPLAVDWMCVWNLWDVEPGQQIDLTVEVLPLDAQTVYNQAWVLPDVYPWGLEYYYGTPDPNMDNNMDEIITEVTEEADLSVVKFSKPDEVVQAGEFFTYTIFVENLGPAPAQQVSIRDEILSSGSFYTVTTILDPNREDEGPIMLPSPEGGMTMEFHLHEPLEPKGPDNQGRWVIQIVLQADETQDVNNLVEVFTREGGSSDPDLSNNQAEDSIYVGDVADLSVAKTAEGEVQVVGQPGGVFNITTPGTAFPQAPSYTTSATQVTAGRRVRYTLTVTNNGPSTAENVVVVDPLPTGVVLYPGSLVLSQGSCDTGTPGSELDPMVCGLGTLASGQTATITFQVVAGTSVLPGSMLANDALVTSDIFDADNSDNQASVQTTVNTWADMSVTKSAVGEVVTGCDATADLPSEVTAGKTLRYELTVQNNGASDAVNVQVMDVLPDLFGAGQHYAVTFDRAVGATCRPDDEHALWTVLWPGASATGQAIMCDLGAMQAGARKTFDVYVRVNPSVPEGTVIDNGALVLFGPSSPPTQPPPLFPGFPTIPPTLPVTNDPYTENNFVVQNTEVHAAADLSIRKTANPWKVFAGEQVMYEVSVTNHGPSNAYEVDLDDYLPEGVLAEIVTDPACEIAENGDYGEYVSCDWEVFPVGETKTFYIFARVQPEAEPWTVSNEVVVESEYAYDSCDYNDRATAPILIQGRADLKVQKFGKPEGEVRAGDELTYTVIVDNLGTGYAHNVTLDDVMESDGSFDLLEVTSDRDALCDPVTGAFENEMFLSCALSDTLEVKGPAPGSGRWMITVVVLANEPQDINNVAYVAGSDYDPDLSNNEAMAEHEITAVADLELTKEAWGEMPVGCEGETELWLNEVAAGGMVTYTLTVSNTGPSTAENVVLLDEPLPLPNLLEIDVESITASQGSCQTGHIVDQGRLSCNLGTILPGESANVTFVAHVPTWVQDYTVLVNDAQAYSDMFDDNNGNDMVTNHIIVSRVADLEVVKTQEPEISLPTWDITYTITVSNLGLSDVEGVFISDTIPVQVLNPTWTCCASDDGQCDIPCEPPTCPVEPCPWPDIGLFAQADIPAGEWVIYTIEGTLDIWPCGPFTNTVELIPPQSQTHPGEDIDPCDENNIAEAVNNPFCHFDPLVLKAYPGPDSPP